MVPPGLRKSFCGSINTIAALSAGIFVITATS
jgi:hypothetical protein